MLKGVRLVSIPVRDQNKALDFYTEKLGFSILTDQPFDGKQRWIELSLPGSDTLLALYAPKGQEDRIGTFSNIAFYSDNVQQTYEELKSRGVEFLAPPKKEHWGTSSVFKDADGNQFALSSR